MLNLLAYLAYMTFLAFLLAVLESILPSGVGAVLWAILASFPLVVSLNFN